MQSQFPVYTEETVCQDCYKCVRECPVKAIRVENEHARVMPERCVACGRCVRICPSGAKVVRTDTPRVRALIASGTRVFVSLAPSWVAAFPEWTPGQLIAALRRLGFAGVSETALGAQEVSAALADELSAAEVGLFISSACPAAVDLLRIHIPDLTPAITRIASPALTHAALLRRHFGPDASVVFIGPCAAKKNEADRHPDLLAAALTFAELSVWLQSRSVSPALFTPGPDDVFVPSSAAEGALYPLVGGMLETLAHYGTAGSVRMESISGLKRVKEALSGLRLPGVRPPLFIEALACPGGCVGGPCSARDTSRIDSVIRVRDYARPGPPGPRPGLRLAMAFTTEAAATKEWSEADIQGALSRVGKLRPEDELNCGACGYDTCRRLARALLAGDAETSMCASYMRSIAQRKANALLRCMPSGVVIVGSDLRIIESNRPFAAIAGGDFPERYDARPGLAGVDVETMLPLGKFLRAALRTGRDIRRERLHAGDLLLDIEVFIIEEYAIVGALVEDVTQNEMRRDQIARRAREVINRNITTVQEIAARLGEHMADTEILLSSIAEGFSGDQDDGDKR